MNVSMQDEKYIHSTVHKYMFMHIFLNIVIILIIIIIFWYHFCIYIYVCPMFVYIHVCVVVQLTVHDVCTSQCIHLLGFWQFFGSLKVWTIHDNCYQPNLGSHCLPLLLSAHYKCIAISNPNCLCLAALPKNHTRKFITNIHEYLTSSSSPT